MLHCRRAEIKRQLSKQRVRYDGKSLILSGVLLERCDMTMPLLFLWLPRWHPDGGGEEESGWIQTVAKDGDAWGRQKGRAALWWRYQTTQTEPEDFSFIFRALVHFVWPLVLLRIHILNQFNQVFLKENANSRQHVLEGYFSWKATVLTAQPSWQLDGLSKFHMHIALWLPFLSF